MATAASVLNNFDPTPHDYLEEIVPGRVEVLRLSGAQGCLDLWSTYFATGGAAPERLGKLQRRRVHLRSPERALTIIAWDFNFTA